MTQKLGLGTKFWFGEGQMAEGIKNAAFNFLLLFFYNQVLGLPGYLTGLALFVALVIDSVTDPLAGSISDGLRHRWGRRHPFMYASAIPMAITFALVFSPPAGLGQTGLFLWLVTFTVLARLAMTLYHVPHLALGAELTSDYHERSSVVAWRSFFGYVGAAALFAVVGTFFWNSTPEFPAGQLNPAVYPKIGLFFGLIMAIAIFTSALGTHDRIPLLPPTRGERAPLSVARVFGEMREALQNHSFRPFFAGMLLFFVAIGTERTLSTHMGTYFWGLDGEQVTRVPMMGLLGVVVSMPFWAIAARRMEKRSLFVTGLVWYTLPTVSLPLFKIFGFFPAPDNPLYVSTIIAVTVLASFGAGGPVIASGSMLADIADEHELETGRRQEGIFFGALSFSAKAASGAGATIAGFALSWLIRFPVQADPGTVAPDILLRLALTAGPGVALVAVAGIVLMSRYDLDRQRLDEIQARLARRREGSTPMPAAPTPVRSAAS